MSTTIDSKVVEMKFDNRNFEANVKTSMSTLDKLKSKLDFSGSVKGLKNIETASKSVKMDGLGGAVDAVRLKFSALETVAFTTLQNITNRAVDTGVKLVKSLSVDNIASGWQKFSDQTVSVGTLVAQGNDLEYVEEQLDRLLWYTDETSYNFTDMVANIAKFTATGRDLEESVTAMEGIAGWAALSGQNAATASRAMYQLSQALGSGYMRLEDWKSIQNVSMDTDEFRQKVLDTAVALGTLEKVGDDAYESLSDAAQEVAVFSKSQFASNLTAGKWFTSDVMMAVYQQYAAANEQVRKFADEWGVTVSEAISMMDEMGVEYDKFGLKALKAAQEARTFEDVINSVKDAVSTGWLTTFKLIFGNYEEAKTLWTYMANELYDVFAESGNARNAMLKEWYDMGGRDRLIRGFAEAWEYLKSVIEAVKDAFREVFPETTAKQLLKMTTDFAVFFMRLELTEEAAENLKRTFKGLFSVLDIFRMIVVDLVQGGFNILKRVIGAVGGDVLEFTATVGDSLTSFRDYIKENGFLSAALEKVGNVLVFVVTKVRDFIKSFKEIPFVSQAIKVLRDLWEKASSDFTTFFDGFGERFDKFKVWLQSLDGITLDNLPKVVKKFKDDILSYFDGLGSKLPNIGLWFETLWKKISDGASGAFKKLKPSLEALKEAIKTFFKEHTTALVGLLGVLAGNAMLDVVKTIFGFLSTFKGIFKSLVGALAGLLNAEAMKAKAAALLEFSIAVATLAAALWVLTKIDYSNIGAAVIVLGILVGSLLGVLKLMTKMAQGSGMASWKKGDGIKLSGNITSVASSFIGLAAAILILVVALKQVNELIGNGKGEDIAKSLGLILILMASLAVSLALVNALGPKGGSSLLGAGAAFLGMVLALKILIGVFKDIDDLELKNTAETVKRFLAMVVGMAIALSAAKGNKLGSAIAFITFALAVKMIGSALADLSSLPSSKIVAGAAAIAIAMSAIGEVAGANGKSLLGAGAAFIGFALGMKILIKTLKLFAEIPNNVVTRGLLLEAAFTVVMAIMARASSLGGENSGKAGLAIMGMAAAMIMLAGAMAILSTIPSDKLLKTAGGMAILVGSLSLMMFTLSKLVDADPKAMVGKIGSMIVLVGLLGVFIYILTQDVNDIGKAISAAESLAILMVAFAAMAAILTNFTGSFGNMKGQITSLTACYMFMLAMTLILDLLSQIQDDPKHLIGIVGAFSLLIAAFTGMAVLLTKFTGTKITKASVNKFKILGAVAAECAALVIVLGALQKILGIDTKKTLEMTGILILMIGAFTAMSIAISNFNGKKLSKDNTAEFIILGAVLAVLTGVLAAIGAVAKYADPAKTLKLTGTLILLIAAFSAMALVLSNFNGSKIDKSCTAEFIILGALVALLAGIVYALTTFTENPENAITVVSALSLLMLAFSAMFAIISKTATYLVGGNLLATCGILLLVVVALGGVLWAMTELIDPNSVLPIAAALSMLMVSFGAMFALMTVCGPIAGLAAVGLKAIGATLLIVAAVLTIMAGIWSLAGFSKDETIQAINDVCEVLAAIGYGIGNIVASVIAGLVETLLGILPVLGESLSSFMTNLQGFIDGAKGMDDSFMKGILNFIAAMLAMFGAEALSVITTITGLFSLVSFGKRMTEFGEGINSFAESISGLDSADVLRMTHAATAAKSLMDAAAEIPRSDGLVDKIIGQTDLGKFGENMSLFAGGIHSYCLACRALSDDDLAKADLATSIATSVISFAKDLDNNSGLLPNIIGMTDLGKFGKQLTEFIGGYGKEGGLYAYAGACTAFTDAHFTAMDNVYTVADKAVELANKLDADGGIQSWWNGDKDLGDFGNELCKFIGLPNVALGGYQGGLTAYAAACAAFSDTDFTAMDAVYTAAGKAIELSKLIDPTGGIKQWFDGTVKMDEFGKQLCEFGLGLAGLCNSTSGVDLTVITTIADQLPVLLDSLENVDEETLKKLEMLTDTLYDDAGSGSSRKKQTKAGAMLHQARKEVEAEGKPIPEEISGIWDKGREGIIASTNNLAKSVSDTVTSAVNSVTPEMKETGKKVSSAVSEGIKEGGEKVESSAKEVADTVAKRGKQGWSKAGKDSGKSYASGVASGVSENGAQVNTATQGLFSGGKIDMNAVLAYGKKIGIKIPDGIAGGISENSFMVDEATLEMFTGFDGSFDVNGFFKEMGYEIPEGIADGIDENSGALFDEMMSGFEMSSEAVEEAKPTLYQSGKDSVNAIVSGITSKRAAAKTAFIGLKGEALSGLNGLESEMRQIGENAVRGFKDGLSAKDAVAEAKLAAGKLGGAAVTSLQNKIQTHSPSKVFAEIGRFADMGFALGIIDNADRVADAAGSLGDTGVDAMNMAMQALYNAIDENIDYNPVIRPVLDLSDIQSKAASLANLIGSDRAVSVGNAMNSRLEAAYAGAAQNASPSPVKYEFTQNNYSPKALSRMDIYRQTKNQLSAIERVVRK